MNDPSIKTDIVNLEDVTFEDLFDLEEIQAIQDSFAKATGVASIITDTDGAPITEPSNFCRLCIDIIRGTEVGLSNCMKSDAELGKPNLDGPIIQPCLSGGLWDGGVSIQVGDRHIANWLIGQVRNEALDEAGMIEYAREIGADEQEFREALSEVPIMPKERFEQIGQMLFLVANQMSDLALSNLQQNRAILALRRAEAERIEYQQKVIEAQQDAIRELSTPIIPLMESIIVMPLIGNIDTARARDITRSLLSGITQYQAQVVILDITGVQVIDSGVADYLNKSVQAAQLKGAKAIVTGVTDIVAETIVDLGIDWSSIITLRDLQSGLVTALSITGQRI